MNNLKVEYLSINEITECKNNSRTHNKKQYVIAEIDKIFIKRGDLIELGDNYQHRLLCGDSTSEINGKNVDWNYLI